MFLLNCFISFKNLKVSSEEIHELILQLSSPGHMVCERGDKWSEKKKKSSRNVGFSDSLCLARLRE